jgi:hypothetical protein
MPYDHYLDLQGLVLRADQLLPELDSD